MKKSRHEKVNSWITTVAAIFTILGISIFGIISYLKPKLDPAQESLQANVNNENDQSQSSTVEPTDVPETEQNAIPDPNPVPVPTAVPVPQPIIQPTMRPLSTPEVTSEIELTGISENPDIEKKQPQNDPGTDEQKTSENDNNTDNSLNSFTQDNNNLSETNEDTTNTICQFESPGRFVLTSKNDNPSNADNRCRSYYRRSWRWTRILIPPGPF